MVDERPKEEKLLWVIFDRTTTDGEKAAAVERLKQVTGKDARGLVEKYLETASSSSSSSLGSDYQARRISELNTENVKPTLEIQRVVPARARPSALMVFSISGGWVFKPHRQHCW
jgi:hypothetical protein